ncbi:N-acetylmuramoyl-L-alanine amidase [Pararhizobium antarcticum]|uniref:N-acetylmuramoyl-L-alanine amidase n=1 Tax=Pararhizobium antarcticum TaxID=1798805 RepID=A0A657LNX9_9HYPH|nr:N-acetylmuramoyl-L-alanine amidase [Pararhizobium antarcticum]OJF93476.1 hypothetical protein AX760_05660 [Pararhizobium antarcticum]OJG00420.1 hypothetical protein AX761_08310 [Rhizobium sp. 58]
MAYTVKNHKLSTGTTNVPFVKSPNIGGIVKPKFLVIHYTASGPGNDIARYFSTRAANVSAHLVIDRSGRITQCVPLDTKAWHAGKSTWKDRDGTTHTGLNSNSIGIEIENWGPLKRSGSTWLSWTGVPVDSSLVVEARHRYGSPNGGWEAFTAAQIEATTLAAQAICAAYGIDEIVGHDDIAPGRKSDPGPAWSMDHFRSQVFGQSSDDGALWIVRSASGLNIRSGPGAAHAKVRDKELPDGTKVMLHEEEGNWRYISVLNARGEPDFSGWVNGLWLKAA